MIVKHLAAISLVCYSGPLLLVGDREEVVCVLCIQSDEFLHKKDAQGGGGISSPLSTH